MGSLSNSLATFADYSSDTGGRGAVMMLYQQHN